MNNDRENYSSNTFRETERIIAQRDRQRYLEELSELEHEEASAWSKIFWASLSLLIINPLLTAGAVYYFYDQLKTAFQQGAQILNLGSNLKYTAIGLAVTFLGSSLTLLYNLWRVSSLKKQIAKIKFKISQLERTS